MNQTRSFKGFVEAFREYYEKEVRPLIQNGNYDTARSLLNNTVIAMQTERDLFNLVDVSKVHCGLRFLASINLLYEDLGKENFSPQAGTLSYLEAFLAQTKLPKLPIEEEVGYIRKD